jgi:signal transduction histidine kinase
MRALFFRFLISPIRDLALTLVVALGAQASQAAVLVHPGDDRVNLGPWVQVLEDPTSKLEIEQVERSTNFRDSKVKSDLNFGLTHSAWWIRITLSRDPGAPTKRLLEIPYSGLGDIRYYAPREAPVITGNKLPLATRPLYDRNFVFPLQLQSSEEVHYMRVASSEALSVPMRLWTQPAFEIYQQRNLMLQALYFGILLAMMVYNFFLFTSLRDHRFLLYSLYVTFLGLGVFASNGFGRMYLWPDAPEFDAVAKSLFLSVAGAFGAFFSYLFLRLRTTSPRMGWLLVAGGGFMLVLALLMLPIFQSTIAPVVLVRTLMAASFCTGILIIGSGVRAILRGQEGVRFFVLAWTILWLGVLIASLRAFGLLPSNAFTSYSIQFTSVIEMLLLSLALADIVRTERARGERAQQDILEAQQALVQVLRLSEEKLERKVRDRTEQLQEALTQEKAMHTRYVRFGSLISHEFRNPLAIVDSQLSLLRREQLAGIDQISHRVQVMTSATRRLRTMFDKWIESDRLGQSLGVIDPHTLPLGPWLRHLVKENTWCIARHRHQVDVAVEAMVDADEYMLEMAVLNLIDNAAKYSAPGTEIGITTCARPGQVGIAITDTGCGISEEDQTKLGTEFFRVDPEGTVHGMGLGLSIVQRIAKAHGGSLSLTSQPGQGSCFCIWLPQRGSFSALDESVYFAGERHAAA